MSSCAPKTTHLHDPLFWPDPPWTSKVQYVQDFSTPREINIKKSWLKQLHRLITGEKEKNQGLLGPYNVFVDSRGDIYVTDTLLPAIHVFRKSNNTYQEVKSTSQALVLSPIGIALDAEERIFVSDSVLKSINVFNKEGQFLFSIDSNMFKRPTGIAIDDEMRILYVVDTLDHSIKKFDLTGTYLRSIGKRGIANGEFNFPTAICIDKDHRIYVGDSMNFRIQIFDKDGKHINSFGELGDGAGFFSMIKGVAVDSLGHIYVSDAQFDVIQVFDVNGNFLLSFGEPGTDKGQFQFPVGLCIDKNDMIYVVDKLNQRVQIFQYLKD